MSWANKASIIFLVAFALLMALLGDLIAALVSIGAAAFIKRTG